ncbi:GNAT family N-acetyltransferase [Halobacteriales archaeon QS_5_70_15]|nr:MAG: GNAT family N-acetyltransferase [Halobacteriales archaeon QS_5_70_15]
MRFSDELEFGHRGRQEVYDYVERHGAVGYEQARRALGMTPEEFGAHVTVLAREGILDHDRETEEIRVAFEDEGAETYETDVRFAIRQAREEDDDALVSVIRDSLTDDRYIVGESLADVIDHEEVLLRHNELQSRVAFVATIEGQVVGWVHLDRPEQEALAHTATLTVGVHREHRGHGIGERLLERGQRWAEAVGTEKLYNTVPATNEAAIEFLSERGWETEAVRGDHYRIDGEYVDEVMMAYHP